MRVQVEVGELALEHEGVADDVLGVVCGLEGAVLFALHDNISIRQISKRLACII